MTPLELTTAKLAGLRILLVEDDAVIAMLLERNLQRLGITVLGPVGSLSKALDMARLQEFDGAVLDVTIRGGDVYPLAELLMTRGIPFVLATGYKVDSLPHNIRGQRLLRKPYSNDEFTAALQYIAETKLNRAT
jgi:CheY-like chemotaxis protein